MQVVLSICNYGFNNQEIMFFFFFSVMGMVYIQWDCGQPLEIGVPEVSITES